MTEESGLVDTIKSTLVGLVAVVLGLWALIAVVTLLGLTFDSERDTPGHQTMIGWEWYHWIVLAPVWAFILFFIWLVLWSIGESVRGKMR